MSLSESSYIVNDTEVKELRDRVKEQLDLINDEINQLKANKLLQDFGFPLIAILYFCGILGLNKDIFLKYWIQSAMLFTIFILMFQIRGYLGLKSPKIIFVDVKQSKIAFFLAIKTHIVNLKNNDEAMLIFWALGFLVTIYNYFEGTVEVSIEILSLFGIIVFLSSILFMYNELFYEFLIWFHTKIITPLTSLEILQKINPSSALKDIDLQEIYSIKGSHMGYFLIFAMRDLLIIFLIFLIMGPLILNPSWGIFKDIIILTVFQILIYVTFSSFFSFRKWEEILEAKKLLLIRVSTFLQKDQINRGELSSANNNFRLSFLFQKKTQRFAIIFSWVEVISNGELNIPENYDILYKELGIPPD